ncbi:MAG: hypothetical protein JWL71_3900 [Acidobacteria bacterium]|nr:hypothetical protein [Acidobacteriota bacterium]
MRISIRDRLFLRAVAVSGTAALDARAPQAHHHPAEGGADHHPQTSKLKTRCR